MKLIAAEHAHATRRTLTAWHQGSPNRSILDVADPPRTDGRYHRKGERATWYGSSSEQAAWAELPRNPPDGVDPREVKRRIGRASFDVVALDVTNVALLEALGVSRADLVSMNRETCQTLADVAAEAGFDAVLGPSAAMADETTLAVLSEAIRSRSHDLVDSGVRTAPSSRR